MSLESIASEVVADGTKSTELMIATLTYIYIFSWKLDQRGCHFPSEIKIKLKH